MSVLAYETEPVTDAPADRGIVHRRALPAWVLVIGLTLLGGVLRFSFLDRPPIWGDEAMTYMRISGNYRQMLDALQDAGFSPLHYSLLWWIRDGMRVWAVREPAPQTRSATTSTTAPTNAPATRWKPVRLVPGGVSMTPFMMRLVPALCGTLMIPAMYFLAVQIVSRRAALLTALFTACSAYLLGYSRDAKMYMDFWLFCALSAGTLLWWLRVRTLSSWLCWIASSIAMLGLHAGPGTILLGIELLIVLTARRANWLSLAFLPLGVVTAPASHGYPLLRRRIDPAYSIASTGVLAWLRRCGGGSLARRCCSSRLASLSSPLVPISITRSSIATSRRWTVADGWAPASSGSSHTTTVGRHLIWSCSRVPHICTTGNGRRNSIGRGSTSRPM
jgi:hypothetical protein